ncbi:16S rRNA (guanine(527)-N(7))-methyltransferase RsmG [Marivivens sp. JLT3646]|uniref:16S rRNA (guanine(527)-N(7))-methyltransferase RsmG n=1 Tax=Marivivens sp. JLT3646 TaxID=1920883 RepID=UPI0007FFA524|nr:16S rRNA (guanine(527)-N(7))-methyltransferase RsmG [Marivivens sp. JLT3646]APO88057.1 16S rRNA (guanine(527)-N(7))-methyltransferase RsmG [Marivivens sp. JLT3646]OBR35387.1 16S rRNA (guanine(527)-N(7))-methyltransferase RsmG [Donghicola sp. JL3646]
MISGVDVSRETLERLGAFEDLVRKWTKKINLIARNDVDHIWDRHIVDSAQVWASAPDEWNHWVDIGSGGGFPAIILATIAVEKKPDARFTLIESDQRKATFLRTAIRELNLNAIVLDDRIELAPPQNADVISARALASLTILLGFAERHLAPTGIAVFQKGKIADDEIIEAKHTWAFDYNKVPSITNGDACVISIKGFSRV